MKYFTYELWKAFQSENSEDAERQWSKNLIAYQEALKEVMPLLSKTAIKMFVRQTLHDSQLINIDTSINGKLTFTLKSLDATYQLTFKGLQEWSISYNINHNALNCAKILEWGYEEMTLTTDKFINLKVLFSSGADCNIKFKNIFVKKIK